MENHRITIFVIILLSAALPHSAFAYARDTHKGLTEAIVKAYEQMHGDVFSAQEQGRMIQGSWDEDDSLRFVRHFFDPVNNRGLVFAGIEYLPSKIWAQDTEGQGNYSCLNAWLCAGKHIGYNDKLFSSPTDFSWDRAIYEYVWGDKARATETLGHILHLIQDSTVPAHVRNDPHPSHEGMGDADPYEAFASQYGRGQISVPASIGDVSVPGIGHVLDDVAGFTNKNFVSKDTLFESYESPRVDTLTIQDGYMFSSLGYKVAQVKIWKNKFGNVTRREIFIDDEKQSVASDYWRVLSKVAIENGIGVIDLFFKSVEQEKKTGALKARNMSAAEIHVKETARKGFNTVKALYGSSLSQSELEDLLGDNAGQAGAAALAVADSPSPAQENTISQKPSVPTVREANFPKKPSVPPPTAPPLPVQEDVPKQQPSLQDSPAVPAPDTPQASVPAPSTTNVGGASGGSPTGTSGNATQSSGTSTGGGSTPSAAPSALSLSILSPNENEIFATTSVAFTGTTSASSLVTAAYDSTLATTTTDGSGAWAFSLSLPSGTTTVSFLAATSSEVTATSTRTVGVDTTPPGAPNVSISECSGSFTASDCTIATTTATIGWADVSGAAYYGVIKNNVLLATTTATTTTTSVSASATTTFSVVAYRSNGTAATSTDKTVFVTTQPLIISEIAWAGTNASVEDEWIELRNMTSSTLDLAHFVITTPDGSRTIPLSGTISGAGTFSGFLLVERNSGAISTVSPNPIVVNFDQLSDSGEQLLLQWGNGSATTTVDSTPLVATCSGWCAGALNGSVGYSVQSGTSTSQLTMERKNSSADGSLAASWQTIDGYSFYGTDRSGNTMYSTAGVQSSTGHPSAGWYCSPDTASITSGVHYTPTSGTCTYLTRAISTQANRHGTLFRGDVASSTVVRRHYFAKAYTSLELTDAISSPQAGEHFFIAIYEGRVGPAFNSPNDDDSLFEAYFTTGAGAPPHSNYFVIPWVYGP